MINTTELYHSWKKYNTIKDKKKLQILLKVIQRIYDKNQKMQEVIDTSTKEVCTEEGVSLKQVSSYFDFSLLLSIS